MSFCTVSAAPDPVAENPSLTLYVSPTGDDRADGRQSEAAGGGRGPFATLERVRDEIRRLRSARNIRGPVDVVVLPGVYPLSDTFELSERDSGTVGATITYRALPGQTVILSAGRQIGNCTRVEPQLFSCGLAEISPRRMGKLGVDDRLSASLPPFEVFMEGRRAPLARWPNAGHSASTGYNWSYIEGSDRNAHESFTYAASLARVWQSTRGITVHIWAGNDWFDEYIGLAGQDGGRRLIRLGEKTTYPIQSGRRFAVLNAREDLDTPGEWHYDAAVNQLLIFARPDQQQIAPTVSRLDTAIRLQNASHVRLEGFTVEHTRKTAITISGGHNARVNNCTVRNAGGFGVEIRGGTQHAVTHSNVHDTGYGGIVLSGGDRKTLTAAGHIAADNHIHHTGRLVRAGRAGIHLEGVGNTARGNSIHHTPGMAVLMAGNDHLLELNDVHHACEESSDCGAIYTGRDWTSHGNTIRHNRIHDVYGYGMQRLDTATGTVEYATPHGARGIYLDDAASGFEITGNILYNVPYIMLQIGGGRDNTVTNNIFLAQGYAIWMDARWPGFPWEKSLSSRLRAMPYNGPVWRERFPKLAQPMRNPQWPEGNQITRNIIVSAPGSRGAITPLKYTTPPDSTLIDQNIVWNNGNPIKVEYQILGTALGGRADWDAWRQTGFDQQSIAADPRLTVSAGTFTLMDDSPARTLGFQDIPFARMPTAGGATVDRSVRRIYRVPLHHTSQ